MRPPDELAEIWRSVRRGQVFPRRPLGGLLGLLGSRDHLVPQSGLRALVADHLAHQLLERMPVPFHVVAVDVVTGEELLLANRPALAAVLASAAIPAVLPSVAWEDRRSDGRRGGNHTPIPHAIQLGAREIYVLPTGHACALEEAPASALGIALHALSLLAHSRLIADIELYRDRAKLVVMPPPCPLSTQPIDFAHADDLIERWLAESRRLVDGGGAERPPSWMRMHRHKPPVG